MAGEPDRNGVKVRRAVEDVAVVIVERQKINDKILLDRRSGVYQNRVDQQISKNVLVVVGLS